MTRLEIASHLCVITICIAATVLMFEQRRSTAPHALRSKGDVTVNGKAGFFSFFFQAKDRRYRRDEKVKPTRQSLGAAKRPRGELGAE